MKNPTPQETTALGTFLRALAHYRMQVGWLIVLVLVPLAILRGVRPQDFLGGAPLGLTGAALVVLGALLRSWAAGVIHKSQALAQTGPYALFRHPLYVGSFLMALGVCVVIGDPWLLVAVVLFLGVTYIPMMQREEAMLAGKFPQDFAAYAAHTARFFPRRLPRLRAPWSPGQWWRNREYNTSLTGLVLLAVVELWRRGAV